MSHLSFRSDKDWKAAEKSPETNRTLSPHPWSDSWSSRGRRRRCQLQVSLLLHKTATSSPASCSPGTRRIQALTGRQRHWRGALPSQVVGRTTNLRWCAFTVFLLQLYSMQCKQRWTQASWDSGLLTTTGKRTICRGMHKLTFLKKILLSPLVYLAGLMGLQAKTNGLGRTWFVLDFFMDTIFSRRKKKIDIFFSLMLDADGTKSFHHIACFILISKRYRLLQLAMNSNTFKQVHARINLSVRLVPATIMFLCYILRGKKILKELRILRASW